VGGPYEMKRGVACLRHLQNTVLSVFVLHKIELR
jgi:hypothetical protein